MKKMYQLQVIIIVLASVAIAMGRFTVPGHGLSWPGSYEAFAHIWVGILIAISFSRALRVPTLICLVVITVLETVIFLLRGAA